MSSTSPARQNRPLLAFNDNTRRGVERRPRLPAQRGPHPALGMEALDRLGIDIDQDPRAFAKFLELKNLA